MRIITAVELRTDLQEIIRIVESGQDVVLSYRNKTPIRLVSNSINPKTSQKLLKHLAKNKNSLESTPLDNNTPDQDKNLIHKRWSTKYSK
jgi:antitoxin (DNA-binding transcriptional repressor) of toxin-antitoxin stability system